MSLPEQRTAALAVHRGSGMAALRCGTTTGVPRGIQCAGTGLQGLGKGMTRLRCNGRGGRHREKFNARHLLPAADQSTLSAKPPSYVRVLERSVAVV